MNILIIIKFIYKVTKIRKNNLEDDICLQLASEICFNDKSDNNF